MEESPFCIHRPEKFPGAQKWSVFWCWRDFVMVQWSTGALIDTRAQCVLVSPLWSSCCTTPTHHAFHWLRRSSRLQQFDGCLYKPHQAHAYEVDEVRKAGCDPCRMAESELASNVVHMDPEAWFWISEGLVRWAIKSAWSGVPLMALKMRWGRICLTKEFQNRVHQTMLTKCVNKRF